MSSTLILWQLKYELSARGKAAGQGWLKVW